MGAITISQWGNSLGVRLPQFLARSANLKAGDTVTIDLRGDEIVLKPVRARPDVNALIKKITARNRHGAVEFGPDRGGEVVEW
jgi:antitoxin MazE